MFNALIISKNDDVVVVTENIKKGENVNYKEANGEENSFIALNDIMIYHKIAKNDIKKGLNVIKYNEHIGVAKEDIKKGMHVHIHNVEGVREAL